MGTSLWPSMATAAFFGRRLFFPSAVLCLVAPSLLNAPGGHLYPLLSGAPPQVERSIHYLTPLLAEHSARLHSFHTKMRRCNTEQKQKRRTSGMFEFPEARKRKPAPGPNLLRQKALLTIANLHEVPLACRVPARPIFGGARGLLTFVRRQFPAFPAMGMPSAHFSHA